MKGELAALAAAFVWALSTVMFGQLGKFLSPLLLNLAKGIVAIALTVLTLLLWGNLQPQLSGSATGWLLLSGVIGIGLGDTAYFMALNHLGARRVLLIESLAPPMTALLALLFLGEQLSAIAWFGILLTLLGVAWVIAERTPIRTEAAVRPGRGVIWGLLAALGQSVGAVLSRSVLADTVVDPLWSGLLRIIAGVGVLCLILGLTKSPRSGLTTVRLRPLLPRIVLAAFLATYLGIWLQQVALKYSPAGIAQALLATSPLFVLPISVAMGDRVTGRAILGGLVAVGGIWLLTNGA